MHTKTSATFFIVILATIAVVLITAASFSTISALAWNHGRKSSDSQNSIGTSSTTSNADLKSLFTCISNEANGLNGLTTNKVLNCYTQTLTTNNKTIDGISSSVGPNLSNGNNNPIETSDSG
ncbi:MAG: hypothetical protein WA220_09950 [Candidatus Nitrosopolaris sp.]